MPPIRVDAWITAVIKYGSRETTDLWKGDNEALVLRNMYRSLQPVLVENMQSNIVRILKNDIGNGSREHGQLFKNEYFWWWT